MGYLFLGFFGVENTNLGSDRSSEVIGGHWGHPMTSKMEVISEYTSYSCGVSFPRFFWAKNPNLRSDQSLEVNGGH